MAKINVFCNYFGNAPQLASVQQKVSLHPGKSGFDTKPTRNIQVPAGPNLTYLSPPWHVRQEADNQLPTSWDPTFNKWTSLSLRKNKIHDIHVKFPHLAELLLPAPRRASCSATTNFVHVHVHFKLNVSPIFILITWAPPLPLRLPLRVLLWVLLRQVHWCQKLYFAQLFQPMPKTQVPLDYKYAEFFQSLL